jgi:predicted Co/Zn/Cd cation transporter (cation efflux family)
MSTPLRILIALVGLVLLAIGVFALVIALTFGMLDAGRSHVMVLLAVAIFALIGGGWLMAVAWMAGRRTGMSRPADAAGPHPPEA